MVGTNSVAVNRVDPSDLKTASLKVMVADVLVAFTANAVDMLGAAKSLNETVVDTAVLLVALSYTVPASVRISAPSDVPDNVNANVKVLLSVVDTV